MRVHVRDDLVRLVRVPGGLTVVVQLLAALHCPVRRRHLEVAEVAGQAQLDQVGLVLEVGQLVVAAVVHRTGVVADRGQAVGVREQAGAEALAEHRSAVHRGAAVHGVAQAVGERGDARAAEVALGGLLEQRSACDLAEVPALAVEEHLLAVDAVARERQLVEGRPHVEQVLLRVVAHEVEPEAVHVVVAGPGDDGVDHRFACQGVLRGDVLAAGRGLDSAGGRVEAVVVAGHHLVEHGRGILPAGARVVEHLVEHHLQARRVERAHHGAELARAGAAVGLGRVGALGRGPVERVVAPVEAVLGLDRGDGRLLLLGVRRQRREVARVRLRVPVLGDGRDVERGQQVHRGQARVRELAQVRHASRALLPEREVRAAELRGQGLVGDREVADVQLVDGLVDLLLDLRGLRPRPHLRGPARVVEVDDDGVRRALGEGHGRRVGDGVRLDRPRGRDVDAHLVQVAGVVPVEASAGVVAVDRPGAVGLAGRLEAERVIVQVGILAPGQQGDLLGRGCPQGEGRHAVTLVAAAVAT